MLDDVTHALYRFKGGFNVELLHKTNNKCAAENAMLKAFKRTRSEIITSGGKPGPGVQYVTFDGTKFH